MARNWPCIARAAQAAILAAALLALGAPAKAQNGNARTTEALYSPAANPPRDSARPHYPAKPVDDAVSSSTQPALVAETGGTPSTPSSSLISPRVALSRAGSSKAASPARPYDESTAYIPITTKGRLRWFVRSTVGPESLAGGVFSSAFGTGLDDPHEYGGGWSGFGKRYGMRLTGVSTSNAMEASLGAMRGEDPRYFRVPEDPFGSRVWHVVRMTFVARQSNGTYAPAYARFAAIGGSNYLSNSWRARSDSGAGHAATRVLEGFGGRMAGNAFTEFWPDISQRLLHRER